MMKTFCFVILFVLGCKANIFGIHKIKETERFNPRLRLSPSLSPPPGVTTRTPVTSSTGSPNPWTTTTWSWWTPYSTTRPYTYGGSSSFPQTTTTWSWWTPYSTTRPYTYGSSPSFSQTTTTGGWWTYTTPYTFYPPTTTPTPSNQCPYDSLTSVDGSTCFYLVRSNKTFIEAEQACKQLGGHLASFHNAFDNMLVNGNFI